MNPASRINAIIESLEAVDQSMALKTAWERQLGIENNALADEDVLEVLQAVLAEIRSMELKLQSIGVPSELVFDCTHRLRHVFSPANLASSWIGHKQQLAQLAIPIKLEWAAWALSQFDENEIDETAFSSLQESLAAQVKLLSETDIPIGLRDMLERQTDSLRRALKLYRIQGVLPVQKAVSDAVGELVTASPSLVAQVETSSSNVQNVFTQSKLLIGKAADFADKGSKITKFGKEVYELGMSSWQIGQNLLMSSS